MISVHLGPVFLFENLAKRLVLFLFSVYSVYSVVFAWFFDHRIHGIHGRIPILLILFADAPDPYFRTRWLVPPQQTKRKTGGTSMRVRLVFTLHFSHAEPRRNTKEWGQERPRACFDAR